MPTYNGHPYSSTHSLNLKDGLLRFGRTWSSNPFASDENGLYINSSDRLIYSGQGIPHDFLTVSPSVSPST